MPCTPVKLLLRPVKLLVTGYKRVAKAALAGVQSHKSDPKTFRERGAAIHFYQRETGAVEPEQGSDSQESSPY